MLDRFPGIKTGSTRPGNHPHPFQLPPATRNPFDIETFEPIFPPEYAITKWIPDNEPDLDWFNRPRHPSNPDPDGYDQSQTWQAPEIQLDDGRILVLEST